MVPIFRNHLINVCFTGRPDKVYNGKYIVWIYKLKD